VIRRSYFCVGERDVASLFSLSPASSKKMKLAALVLLSCVYTVCLFVSLFS